MTEFTPEELQKFLAILLAEEQNSRRRAKELPKLSVGCYQDLIDIEKQFADACLIVRRRLQNSQIHLEPDA